MESFRFRFHIRDLLALIFFVALILGLFLPALQATREAARQTECANNLKQLGLGVHSYSDTFRRLPPGTVPNAGFVPTHRLSWAITLTPFLEQVFFLFNLKEPWDSSTHLPPMVRNRNDDGTFTDHPAPIHRLLMCPAKRLPEVRGLSVTAYVGPAGLGADAADRDSGNPRNGIWGYDRQITLTDIHDGLSETLLFLETTRDSGPWTAGGPPTVRGFIAGDEPSFGLGRQLGGFHPKGCQAAMADGSVKLLELDIESDVLAQHLTLAEEPVNSTPANDRAPDVTAR
jgi:hypothetical protein